MQGTSRRPLLSSPIRTIPRVRVSAVADGVGADQGESCAALLAVAGEHDRGWIAMPSRLLPASGVDRDAQADPPVEDPLPRRSLDVRCLREK